MKNLMKIFSILLVGCLIALIVTSSIFPLDDIPEFASKLSQLFTMNIIPIIIMSIACFCLQRKDENYLVRIILFFMLFSTILSASILAKVKSLLGEAYTSTPPLIKSDSLLFRCNDTSNFAPDSFAIVTLPCSP